MGERFEQRDLGSAVFRDVNLSAAQFEQVNLQKTVFHDVNLGQAEFDDVNLEDATIHNANLSGLTICDAYIRGMTVFGFSVHRLIEDELDRRDPERQRLRMADVHDPESVRAVLARLDELRAEFGAMVRSLDAALLTTRPAEGEWSVIEILRHLLFAEDLYLNRWILRNDTPWNAAGQLPDFLAGNELYADVGQAPTTDVDAVLDAWDGICQGVRKHVASATEEDLRRSTRDVDFGQGTVGGVLQGMAQHDLVHIRQAEAAVKALRGDQAGLARETQ